VLVVFFRSGESQRVANYLLLLITTGVFALVITGVAEAMSNRDFLWLFIWNPFVFIPMSEMGRFGDDELLVAAIIVDLVLCAALLGRAIIGMRAQGEVLRQAEEIVDSDPLNLPG
jgi:hypothetical protein